MLKKILFITFILSTLSFLNSYAGTIYTEEKEAIHKECSELGFKADTTDMAKCKLELFVLFRKTLLEEKKLEAALAQTEAAEATARATEATARAQESLARDSRRRALDKTILRSQGLISGRCTLANLSNC